MMERIPRAALSGFTETGDSSVPEPSAFEEARQVAEQIAEGATQMWARYGKRTFSFEAGMFEDFVHTEPPFDDLYETGCRTPFPVVMYNFEAHDPTDDEPYIASMLVSDAHDEDSDSDGLLVLFWNDPHQTWHYAYWPHKEKQIEKEKVTFFLPMSTKDPLEEKSLRVIAAELLVTSINATLYLADPRVETQESPELAERLQALRKRLRKTRSVKAKQRLRDKISRVEADTPIVIVKRPRMDIPVVHEGTGAKLTHRVLVRGHWRNQPFGRRRQQRRRIWIAPFWRGPEDAEIIHRDYRVDKEQS